MYNRYKLTVNEGKNILGYLPLDKKDSEYKSYFYLNDQEINMDQRTHRDNRKEKRMSYREYFINVVIPNFRILYK